jgi:hypothetical protein
MTAVSRIARFVVIAGSLLFAATGMGFWFAPEQTAAQMGWQAGGATSLMVVRADLGGLFMGMAVLYAAAIWKDLRLLYFAVATLLGAIAIGRLIGWISVGPSNDFADMGIELGLVAATMFMALARRGERPIEPACRAAKLRTSARAPVALQ